MVLTIVHLLKKEEKISHHLKKKVMCRPNRWGKEKVIMTQKLDLRVLIENQLTKKQRSLEFYGIGEDTL